MALIPTSGQFSMGDINVELGLTRTTANTSLAGGVTPVSTSQFGRANSSRNKVAPHAMSEFRGYLNKAVTFSSFYTSSGTSGTVNFSGTVTITGANATFTAFATVSSGANFRVNTNINIGGTTRAATKIGVGTQSSTTFTLAPGTYSYSGSVAYVTTGGSGYGNGGISFTQA